MKSVVWSLPLFFMLFAVEAQEGAIDTRIYVAPTISYDLIDSDRGADNGLGMRFSIGFPLNQSLVAETSLFGSNHGSGGGDLSLGGALLDGLYFYHHRGAVARFVVLGAGLIRSTTNSSAVTNTMANLGWGVLYQFDERVGMRADLRYRLESGDSGRRSDWLLGVGIVVPIGDLP